MKYIGSQNFGQHPKNTVGILITNLGTPAAPTKTALKIYLREFLSDPRVIEIPRLVWWFILNFIILNIRPARSAEAYSTVWTEEGSPLLVNTRNQAEGLKNALSSKYGDEIAVDFGMRYGEPSIESAIKELESIGIQKLLVLPLYPQYSGPTTGSTFDAIAKFFVKQRWIPEVRFVSSYHDHPAYIEAIASQIEKHRSKYGESDMLIFSYHGEPQSYMEAGDPYFHQCQKTSELLVKKLNLEADKYLTTFQSRFGPREWLQPYTDETLKDLPNKQVESVQIICPGFASDCLETIEEINVENRQYFLDAGGKKYEYIPCLNSESVHINALSKLVTDKCKGWINDDISNNAF